jgi:hypothetical protein
MDTVLGIQFDGGGEFKFVSIKSTIALHSIPSMTMLSVLSMLTIHCLCSRNCNRPDKCQIHSHVPNES